MAHITMQDVVKPPCSLYTWLPQFHIVQGQNAQCLTGCSFLSGHGPGFLMTPRNPALNNKSYYPQLAFLIINGINIQLL